MKLPRFLFDPAPPDEDDRCEALYRVTRSLVALHGSASLCELPTEHGDANKPVVTRLRQQGYTVTFDPGPDDGAGAWWRVSR